MAQRRKTSTRSKNRKSKTSAEEIKRKQEVWFFITLAFSILSIISALGFGGTIGNKYSDILYGLFGFLAIIFPIVLFIAIIFTLINYSSSLCYHKLFSGIILFCSLEGLIQCFYDNGVSKIGIIEYYDSGVFDHSGGGLLGGIISKYLIDLFGYLGAIVILLLLIIISFIKVTQKSLFETIDKAFKYFKKKNEPTKEKLEIKKLKKDIKEEKRKLTIEKRNSRKKKKLQQKLESTRFMENSKISFDYNLKEQNNKNDNKESLDAISQLDLIENTNPNITIEANTRETEKNSIDDLFSIIDNNENLNKESTIVENNKTTDFVNLSEDLEQDLLYTNGTNNYEDDNRNFESINQTEEHRNKRNLKVPPKELSKEIDNVSHEIVEKNETIKKEYKFPPISLLKAGDGKSQGDTNAHLKETAIKLQETLKNFGVNVTITNVSCGPSVTRYELSPETGVKVSKIVSLTDDIKLNLATADIRIEAPIPGKAAVGIEVPNKNNAMVMFRDLVGSEAFKTAKSKLAFAVGKDIAGKAVVTDIAKMPHLLIAGATGSGKSVCINTLIMSILYKATPDEVKLIMIDPKVVELSVYNKVPHLLIPVVTDPKKAAGALNWAVVEMTNRYNLFAAENVRNLTEYNKKIEKEIPKEGEDKREKLPQIVIIVDELADLMMVAPGDVEDAICRLAQLARAAGIHLVIATQRPSVNVITGLIKANMPSRIAFAVTSGVDSRTILDMNGAEKLLGKGDMLFSPQGYPKPARLQGAFISDQEVTRVVDFLSDENSNNNYNEEVIRVVNTRNPANNLGSNDEERDVYFKDVGEFIIEKERASIGMIQRNFKMGFNRAGRIMDQLCDAGVVGPEEGTKPRKVLMTMEEFHSFIEENNI